jgi:hypothetical protein
VVIFKPVGLKKTRQDKFLNLSGVGKNPTGWGKIINKKNIKDEIKEV